MRVIIFLLFLLLAAPSYGGAVSDDAELQMTQKTILHTVQKSETVSSILKSYNLSLDRFLKSNRQLNGTNLTLSLGQQVMINKRDIGSANDTEIVRQVKVYLQSIGSQAADVVEEKPQQTVRKAELIKELTTVEKYEEKPQHFNGRLQPWSQKIKVTMMLPLTKKDGTADKELEAFYKGAVLAMNQLKSDGVSLDVDVYDTKHSPDEVRSLINEGALRSRNIVIGPVYNEQFSIVAEYLRGRGTILVSPLATVNDVGEYVFQLAPTQASRYRKLKDFFHGKNVIFYTTASDDKSFDAEIRNYISMGASVHTVRGDVSEEGLKNLLTTTMQNVVVVSAKNKSDIELVLSRIATLNRTLSSQYKMAVVGSPEFSKIEDRKREDFFKTNTYYTTSYHQDRSDESSLEFERQYVDLFGEQPNLYSYRAYDAVMLFLSVMVESDDDFYRNISNQLMQLLQVSYRFVPEDGRNVNTEWMLVNYKPDYTISIK